MHWVHFNKKGEICHVKIDAARQGSAALPRTCPSCPALGTAIKWIKEDVAAKMRSTLQAPPPLRLKPFVRDAEIGAAENELNMKGLCKTLSETKYPDRKEDEIQSAIRFVAHSHYLKGESKKIADQIFPARTMPAAEEKLQTAPQITDAVNKVCNLAPYPMITFHVQSLGPNTNQGLEKLMCEGMACLNKISKENKADVEKAARYLASHADMMDAKGYGAWIQHFRTGEEKKAIVVHPRQEIVWNGPPQDMGSFGGDIAVAEGWNILTADYTTEIKNLSDLKEKTEYWFMPRGKRDKKNFRGTLVSKVGNKLTIDVVEVAD